MGIERDVNWKDPDVVAGWGLEGLDLDGDWKERQLEGSGWRFWMGIGRVGSGWGLEGTSIGCSCWKRMKLLEVDKFTGR